MKLLKHLENGSMIPRVSVLAEGQHDYMKLIRMAYREQRRLIEANEPHSKLAKAAARQARALLHMAPEVQSGDMKAVRDLAIKTWNHKFTESLREIELQEASLQEKIEAAVREFIGKPTEVTDDELIDKVLDLARVQQQKMFKTVNGTARVVHYTYRGAHFAAVEKPNSKTTLFKGTPDE
jgi:hypothetical protein